MNMNSHNQKIKIPTKRCAANAKATDVTPDTDTVETTAEPCSVDEDNHLSELITWKQIASSPAISAIFDNKKQPGWIQSVERLDETYLIGESTDVCRAPEISKSTDSFYEDALLNGFGPTVSITRTSTPLTIEEINPIEEMPSFPVNRNKNLSLITLSPPKPVELCQSSKIIRISPIHIYDEISMTADSLDSAKSNDIFMSKRLRKKMNLLRESTDSLVSSFDTWNDNALPDNSTCHKVAMLPSIAADQRHVRQGRRKVSYWERAVRNSKNRFTTLAQRRVHESSKSPLILPPVVSIHQR